MDKKKLLALAIFLIMGFFIVTFANPAEELRPTDNQAADMINNNNNQDNSNASQQETNPTRNATNNGTTANRVANNNTTTNPIQNDTNTTNDPSQNGIGNVEVNTYTVNFVDYANKILESQTVEEHASANDKDIKVEDYTDANILYTFDKWNKDFSDVTSNLTVKALYDIKKITANVYVNGKKTDVTVEIAINDETKAKKNIKLDDENINEYIVNLNDVPVTPAGKDSVKKLTFVKGEGYILDITETFIDYTITTDEYTKVKLNGEFTNKLTAHIGDVITIKHQDRTKEGYNFTGYNVETTEDTFTVNTSDVNITASYETIKYTITYDIEIEGNPTEYTVESDDIQLSPASKVGYDFIGWKDQNRKVRNVIAKGTTGDLQLKAKFQARTDINYTVKILEEDLNGNYIEVNSTTYNDGTADKYTKLNAPAARYGFTLNGSKTRRVMVLADGTTTVEFKYARKSYNVTFAYINDQAKSATIVKSVKYEGSVASPELAGLTYTKNNITYVFDKFEKEATNVTKDITINALYNITDVKANVALLENNKLTPIEGSATLKTVNPIISAIKKNNYDQLHKDYIATIDYTKDSDYDYKEAYIIYNPNKGFTVVVTRSLKKYTVTAQNGAHVNGSKAITDVAGKQVKLTHDNKIGYTFTNYLVKYADGTEKSITTNAYTIEKQNVTIYAVYKINTYTVTFVYYDAIEGKTSTKITAEYGKGVTAPEVKDIADYKGYSYTFKKWDKAFNKITQNITVTAQYKIEAVPYTIDYVLNGGNLSNNVKKTYKVTDNKFNLPTPTRLGYTFKGWYTTSDFTGSEVKSVAKGTTGNKTFYAKWTANTYNITYNTNGGTLDENVKTTFTIEDETFALATPTKEGYTFAGWYTDGKFTGSAVTEITKGTTGNKTYYAKWNINTYTITYVLNGGTISGTYRTTYTVEDETFELPKATRDGYNLFGWFENKNYTDSRKGRIYKGTTGDKTFYAKWTQVTYYITYNLNGGSVSPENIDHYRIKDKDHTLINPTKEGYTFKGWSGTGLEGDDNLEVTISTGSFGDRTYTANWIADEYSITYNLDGGSLSDDAKTKYTIEDEYTLPVPTKEGYEFIGWTGSNGEKPEMSVTIAKGNTGARVYTANYKVQTFTVTWVINGVSTPITVDYDTKLKNVEKPATNDLTINGVTYKFIEWKNYNKETKVRENLTFEAEYYGLEVAIKPGKKLEYAKGASRDSITKDITVSLYNLDGKSEDITTYDYQTFQTSSNGTRTLTIKYKVNSKVTLENTKHKYTIKDKASNNKYELAIDWHTLHRDDLNVVDYNNGTIVKSIEATYADGSKSTLEYTTATGYGYSVHYAKRYLYHLENTYIMTDKGKLNYGEEYPKNAYWEYPTGGYKPHVWTDRCYTPGLDGKCTYYVIEENTKGQKTNLLKDDGLGILVSYDPREHIDVTSKSNTLKTVVITYSTALNDGNDTTYELTYTYDAGNDKFTPVSETKITK